MRWLGLVVVLVACGRPAPRAPGLPSVPVLDEAAPVQHRRVFTLRGVAADEVLVRVFTDSACAGPVYLQTTGAGLREGVKVELVRGLENVLSANAVSALGAVSECSSPLRLRYLAALRPGRPSVESRPRSPSTGTHFVVAGSAEGFARVRLSEGTCTTPPLAELSAAEFFEPGFSIDVPVNGSRVIAVDAVNEDMASPCEVLVLTNDATPPRFEVRLASPSPSPRQQAYVHFTGELGEVRLFESPGCTGPVLTACSSCFVSQPSFSRDATTSFSVRNTDRAGNSLCLEADRPWVHDSSLPEEEATVLLEGWPLLGQLPTGRLRVEVFPSSDCSGQAVARTYPSELVTGLYLQQPPGFLSARTWRQDGGLDPCSNAVYWQP
ncbi:MAG: hypothetical protein Q8L48_30830 [Archangium sp.]|nr:hypothetical protein [Archangium sp.]